MYDPTFGLVYYVLSWFGLDSAFGGLEKPGWALFSIVIADVWETTPFILIVASAGLANIPKELYEAARIDGANALNVLARITLPLLSKVLLWTVVPILLVILTSLKNQKDIFTVPPTFVFRPTLDNYSRALIAGDFARYFLNSALVAVVSSFLSVGFGAFCAYALVSLRVRFASLIANLRQPDPV